MTYEEKILRLDKGKVVAVSVRGDVHYGHVERFVKIDEYPAQIGVCVDINGIIHLVTLDDISI